MRSIPLNEMAERLGGTLVCDNPNALITGFATDSREVKPGDLFLAIRGANVDGHAFIETVLAHGAVAAIVERHVAGPHIKVLSLVMALARMAETYRDEFQGPVVGITGSAGKSSAKEFLAAALESLGPIVKTEGNRNTEYTAPLLWVGIEDPAAVVVEMGMRGPGQIAQLCSFSKPTVGLITNIGVAHLSELGSVEAIAQAKGELIGALPTDGTAVLWAEDEFLPFFRELAGGRKVLTFGFSQEADARIVSFAPTGWDGSQIELDFNGGRYKATIPVIGQHQALNAAAAFLVATVVGADPNLAAKGLANAQLPPMRMAIRQRGNVTWVLDMYNSSPPSVIAALETVRSIMGSGNPLDCEDVSCLASEGVSPGTKQTPRLITVLGEMLELGDFAEQRHAQVGGALASFGVDEAVLLGGPAVETIREAATNAGMSAANVRIASSHDEVKTYLSNLTGPAVVVVKGSRGIRLEDALPEGIL